MRRPKADTRSESEDKLKDANQKLKAENRQLRKQLKAAQKEINKLLHRDVERSLDLEEESLPPIKKQPDPKCPQCKSKDIQIIPAGIFQLYVCQECGHKKRVKKA